MTYVVDGFDRDLHPQLSRMFIQYFHTVAASHRRQLIATSHESRLMDLGCSGGTSGGWRRLERAGVPSCSRLRTSTNGGQEGESSYLDGRYGATPGSSYLLPGMDPHHL